MRTIEGYHRLRGYNFLNGRIFVYVGDNTMPPLFDFANVVRAVFDDYGKASELYVREISEDHIGIMKDGRKQVKLIDLMALLQFAREHCEDREFLETEIPKFLRTIDNVVHELPGPVITTQTEEVVDNTIEKELLDGGKKKQDIVFIGNKPQRYILDSGFVSFNGTDLLVNFCKKNQKEFDWQVKQLESDDVTFIDLEEGKTMFLKQHGLLLFLHNLGKDTIYDTIMTQVQNNIRRENIMDTQITVVAQGTIQWMGVIGTTKVVYIHDKPWFAAKDISILIGAGPKNGSNVAKKYLQPEDFQMLSSSEYKLKKTCFINENGLRTLQKIYKANKIDDIISQASEYFKMNNGFKLEQVKKTAKNEANNVSIDNAKDLKALDTYQVIVESIHIAEKLRTLTKQNKQKGIRESRIWPTNKNIIDALYRYIDTAEEDTRISYRWLTLLGIARVRLSEES